MSANTTQPTHLSRPLTGRQIWHGDDLKRSGDWIRQWPDGAVEEIDRAWRQTVDRGVSETRITAEDFPLPGLQGFFDELLDELEDGLGVVRVSGFPVERYAPAELRSIFWGIGMHLGLAVNQADKGEMIGEVRDESRVNLRVSDELTLHRDKDSSDELPVLSSRSRARSNGPLRFHTDGCDLIALLCTQTADIGGETRVASAAAVYNEILARRPDLHRLLCEDYYRYLPESDSLPERERIFALPIFGLQAGKLTTQYSRTFVEQAQSYAWVPQMSAAQIEALDLWAEYCEKLSMTAPFALGDLQILNNHQAYHGRTAFHDDVEGGKERLLLRLWLSPKNNRALPESHGSFWDSTDAGMPRSSIRSRVAAAAE